MPPATLRLTGPPPNPSANIIFFITILRTHTGIDLRTAKTALDQFRTAKSLDVDAPDPATARKLAEELLTHQLIRTAVLITDDDLTGSPIAPIPPPPPAPIHFCPTCHTQLKNRAECPTCGWLLHPSDRSRWNTQGPCPRCGFSYRFDGSHCSHCGATTTRNPQPRSGDKK